MRSGLILLLLSAIAGSTAEAQTVLLRGKLVDAVSTRPVVNANVRLLSTPFQTVSDTAGRFTLRDVKPGNYTIEIEHIAYGRKQQTLRIGESPILDADIALAPEPTKLDGITITALDAEERDRRASGTARRVINEALIDSAVWSGRKLADVLRAKAIGLRIKEGEYATPDTPSPLPVLCIEAMGRGPSSFQPRTGRMSGLPSPGKVPFCNMVPVYLDGLPLSEPGGYLRSIGLNSFARIEWLSALAASTKYGTQTRNQGVLELTTKSGKPR